MNLRVELVEDGIIQYFKIIGEIDAFTAPVLKKKLASVQKIEGLQAELDLSEVAYIDSTGLGVFIGFYKALKQKNSHMKITGVSARLNRLFEITGLNEIIDVELKEGGSQDATV